VLGVDLSARGFELLLGVVDRYPGVNEHLMRGEDAETGTDKDNDLVAIDVGIHNRRTGKEGDYP
jgi:hypothetical protein